MSISHPDPGDLERFLRGELSATESRRVVRHLIGGCLSCRQLAGDLWRPLARAVGATPPSRKDAKPNDYQSAMDRAVRIAREHRAVLAGAREATPALLQELLRDPPVERRAKVERDPRFHLPALCEALLAKRGPATSGRQGTPARPRGNLADRELVELALAVAERLDSKAWGSSIVRDLEARAWAHCGDVAREAGEREEAQRAFRMAHSLSSLGTQDPWNGAELARLEARFELMLGRVESATALGLEAVALYRKLGERGLLAATLWEVGTMAVRAQRVDLAVDAFAEVVDSIEPGSDPARLADALQRLGTLLVETGRGREALGHLWRARSLYERLGSDGEALRVRWMEARATLAVGSAAEGEAALQAVRIHLLESGLGQDAIGVLFDLAELYVRQGRKGDMRRLFGEAILLPYRVRELERGAVAAILILRRAIETESATGDLVAELAKYLAASRSVLRAR